MAKKILSMTLCTLLLSVLLITNNNVHALNEGFTATELASTESILIDGTKDAAWDNADSFNLDTVRQTSLNGTANNANPATGKISVMYNASKLYLFAEINDSTKLNNVAGWDPFNVLEYESYKYNTDYLNIQLDIKHDNPTNYDQGWGSDYNNGSNVAAHFELAAGAGELTYSADGTKGWVYDNANEMFTLSQYAVDHSTIYSTSTDTGYNFEMEIDLADAGVTDFAAGKTIGLYVGYWDRFESCGGTWGEQSLTTTAFQYDNYEPWNGPGWLPEVTFVAAASEGGEDSGETEEPVYTGYTATQTDVELGKADGVKDEAYNVANAIPVAHVAWESENATPATANMYLLWDASYLYVFVEVVDDTHYGYQEGTWLEFRDALEMIIDIKHDTSYTGGYGGDYRGDKMCEGYYKISAGVGEATVDANVQGTHWMWDDQKNNGSYASVLTENGYTVEYKISLGKDSAEFMVLDREIGVGVKIYDKHADDKDTSKTVIEAKNDCQHEGPHNLTTVKLIENPLVKELEEAKTAAKAELEAYKSADLYLEAEQALLQEAVNTGKTNIDAALTIEEVNAALSAAKSAIDEIKTKSDYESENIEVLNEAKTKAKAELEAYKSADLYLEAEQALLQKAVNTGKTNIDAALTIEEVNEALSAAKSVIDGIKTKAEYEAEELEALNNAKTTAKAELEAYKSADLYLEAEQALLASAISAGKTYIDAAKTIEEVNEALNAAKSAIDEIKTKAEYEAEELEALNNAKTTAKAEIEAYKSLVGLSEEQKAKVAEEVNKCKDNINAAKTIEAINEALEAGKTVLDGILPETSSKGCGGSVVATLFASFALLSCVLFLRKRKQI